MNRTISKLNKCKKYLLGIAMFLSLTAVSVTISKGEVNLNLDNYPVLMILLVFLSIVIVLVYIKLEDLRTRKLLRHINASSSELQKPSKHCTSELTIRQKEVYDLIVSGKSNKDIMASLYIEKSTLKTHINQIYKKLKVKNRRELKSNISH